MRSRADTEVRSRPVGRKYRAPDLVPAAGPERSIAFLIIGVPLVLVVLVGLLFADAGSGGLLSVPVLSSLKG